MITIIRDKFTTPYDEHAGREGQRFVVVYKVTAPHVGYDDETLPQYRIRFDDGIEIDALPEEVEIICGSVNPVKSLGVST